MTLNNLMFLLILLLSTITSMASENNSNTESSGHESYIVIRGSSNISHFELINYNIDLEVLNTSNPNIDEKGSDKYDMIRIPVEEFQCSNQIICNDFKKMVNASEYPFIEILIEHKNFQAFDQDKKIINLNAEISLAGFSRRYNIPCRIIPLADSGYALKGGKNIELSDFHIEPPEKVFGAIKVSNNVFINFVFKFQSDDILTENILF